MLHLWCYDQKSVDEDGEVLATVWRRETFIESTWFSCAENPIEGKPWALAGRLVAERGGTDVDGAGEGQRGGIRHQQEREVSLKPNNGEGLNTGWLSDELLHGH